LGFGICLARTWRISFDIRETRRLKMAKPKLGSGGRFKALAKSVGSNALAAWIGRKKYGAKKMAKLSAGGRKGGKDNTKPPVRSKGGKSTKKPASKTGNKQLLGVTIAIAKGNPKTQAQAKTGGSKKPPQGQPAAPKKPRNMIRNINNSTLLYQMGSNSGKKR